MTTLSEKFKQIIIANELGGDLDEALKFSDPDGVRSGKSGWSFGICQFDLANNPDASRCLAACGFSEYELAALKAQTIDVTLLEPRLRAAAGTIARFDNQQLASCLQRAHNLCNLLHLEAADHVALLAVADYDNQFHFDAINKPGYLAHYLAVLNRPFTAEDILEFKLHHTKWGKTETKDIDGAEDCERRYKNVIRFATEDTENTEKSKTV